MELGQDERLRIVVEDLKFLSKLWDQDVGEESLRLVSPMLRKLLVNGELQRAWKAAGFPKEPIIAGSSLGGLLESPLLGRVKYAAAGGARYRGSELRAGTVFDIALSSEEVTAIHASGVPAAAVGLSDFMESAGMIINAVPVPRRTIVKFIANVLGGVHFGSKPEKKPKELQRYRLLDRARREFMLLGHPCVYFELLSIGQAIVASDDIVRFIAGPSGAAGNVPE